MSLYRYFAKASKLPDPNGELLASISPAAIKEANEAVQYNSICITSHHCHSKKIERVTSLSFARKFFANNGSPDVLVDMVSSYHRFH